MLVSSILIILCFFQICQVDSARWTPEQAKSWYESQPLFFGANFVPSTAVNAIELWQTFDTTTIERELQWASQINMNIIRVNLHFLLYQQDAEAYFNKLDGFLAIANQFNIKVMFVIFNECWLPDPKLGPQPDPIPGVHNSQWVRNPGQPLVLDTTKWPLLKQ